MRHIQWVGLLGLGLVSSGAWAVEPNDTGWYIGGKAGAAWGDAVSYRVDVYRSDDTEHLGMYGGYHFTPWFGVEGSWLVTANVNNRYDYYEGAHYYAFSVAPKLSLRVSPVFSLYAKAGAAWLGYGEDFIEDDYYDDPEDRSWSDLVGTVGVGAQFDITDSVKLRIGYDYYDGTLDSDENSRYWRRQDGSIDVQLDAAHLGVHYQF